MLTVEAARLLYQNDSAHDFDHVQRVLANAEQIGRAEKANMDILRTATLLHDIARADQEKTGKDHAAEGARQAQQILADLGCDDGFIKAVVHAIAAHRFRVELPPETLEAQVLYDADKLDSIGAIGLARAFAYGGYLGRPIWREQTEEANTTFHEFERKLVKIKDVLFTQTARKLAESRHQFMLQFVAQIKGELAGQW